MNYYLPMVLGIAAACQHRVERAEWFDINKGKLRDRGKRKRKQKMAKNSRKRNRT